MRFLKAILPNLTISLCAALLTLGILNEFNPRMGFLQGKPALVLVCLTCVCGIVSAAVLYISYRREK